MKRDADELTEGESPAKCQKYGETEKFLERIRGGGGESDGSESLEGHKKPAAKSPEIQEPHRRGKNFPERLMNVLKDGDGGDCIWWVGDKKTSFAVAVHKKKLQRSSLLRTHFNIKDYKVFNRNCSRWGLKRTVNYDVPPGVTVFQCSLFQKDEPHWMHHMRMDSDVQDVFLTHRQVGLAPAQARAATVAAPTAAVGMSQGGHSIARHGSLGSATKSSTKPTSTTANIRAASSLEQHQLAQIVAEALGCETGGIQQTNNNSGNQENNDQDKLLERILRLSGVYLDHVKRQRGPHLSPEILAITKVLEMLQMQGKLYQEERAQIRQTLKSHVDLLEQAQSARGNFAPSRASQVAATANVVASTPQQKSSRALPGHQDIDVPMEALLQLFLARKTGNTDTAATMPQEVAPVPAAVASLAASSQQAVQPPAGATPQQQNQPADLVGFLMFMQAKSKGRTGGGTL